jgi:Protein of unknown function (DUF5818)
LFISSIGRRVDETGTLIRDGGDFALRRDMGRRWTRDMHRAPVDHVEKRLRISGVIVADRLIDVDALGPDIPVILHSSLVLVWFSCCTKSGLPLRYIRCFTWFGDFHVSGDRLFDA